MQLVLNQLASLERGRRVSESIGGLGFGALLGGAGIGLLHVSPDMTRGEKTEARVLGGVMLGLGGLFVAGGITSLVKTGRSEKAANEFRESSRAGGDSAQAFARADDVIIRLVEERRAERLAQGIIGSIAIIGCATGLTLSEIAAEGGGNRMGRRLGWSAGMTGGAMMLGDAIFMEQPVDALARIWREDPSLHQYQAPRLKPNLELSRGGAFLSLTGSL
jgi:hypothetical protein